MITLTLEGSQLRDHLTNTPTPETDPDYKIWKAAESSILGWMLKSMTPEMRRDFLYCNSVKELWDDIQKYSEEHTHDWRIYKLTCQVAKARQGGDNLLQYSSKLKALWREIDYLWPTQNPQSMECLYIAKQRMFTFLMGLNDVYENLRSQLLYQEKRPTLEEAISAVRQEESRLRVSSETHGQNSDALLIKKPEVRASSAGNWTPRPSQPSQTLPAEGDDTRDLLVCNYCKKRRQ